MVFADALINEQNKDHELLAGCPVGTFFIRPSVSQDPTNSQHQFYTLVFVNNYLGISKYRLCIQQDGSVQLLKTNSQAMDFTLQGVHLGPASFESEIALLNYAQKQGLSAKNTRVKLTQPLVELRNEYLQSFNTSMLSA